MSMEDLFKRVDLTVLYPPFVELAKRAIKTLDARGDRYYAISGLRTYEEQDKLYAQGRKGVPGNIVTKAKGGESFHNFGIALDFCRDRDVERAGLQPDWNRAAYEDLASEMVAQGLESGLRWRFVDAPHVQLPISLYAIDLKDLREMYEAGGYVTVFEFLDNFSW